MISPWNFPRQLSARSVAPAFGGIGASGIGRFGGEWAVREFSTEHWVSVQHEPRSYPV